MTDPKFYAWIMEMIKSSLNPGYKNIKSSVAFNVVTSRERYEHLDLS